MFRFLQSHRPAQTSSRLLTPKIFYELAKECQNFANELARHDPLQVDVTLCYRYNDWLLILRCYEPLMKQTPLRLALPIARWQLLTLGGVIWLFLSLLLPSHIGRTYGSVLSSGWLLGLIVLYFIPQRLYGTTVELLEARLLLVVNRLLDLLLSGEAQLSEAAFFRVKEMLEITGNELRQQIDLAHRG